MTEQKALWGWYPAGNVWVKLQVDATGKLVIDPTAIFENPPTDGETEKGPQSDWAYDHWKDPYAHQDTGGKCGITVRTLTGNITLTPRVDTIHQVLASGGVYRTITLATIGALAGDRFVIKHNDLYTSTIQMDIYQGGLWLEGFWAGTKKAFIFDGTNWIGSDVNTVESPGQVFNMALGFDAKVYNRGIALGSQAEAYDGGIALGTIAKGYNGGVAIGYYAYGYNYGVAIGSFAQTAGIRYSQAFGQFSVASRVGETVTNITGSSPAVSNYVQGRYAKDTADATPVYMYLANYGTARFTVKAKSALAFRITVVARDNVANEVAMYTFEGIIKRDAANNTVMSVCNKVVVYEDDATWDCNVTANDTLESLEITITGDATNPVRWSAVLEGVEVMF